MLIFLYLLGFLTGAAAAALVGFLRKRRRKPPSLDDEMRSILQY